MRVILERQNDAVHFLATTGSGARVAIDGSSSVGGRGLGARPMELVLVGLGGCSAIDVATILAKQRQPVEGLTITVDAERQQGVTPALFDTVHLHFDVAGDCDEAKVARAVMLSVEKYCSVARILERTARITHSYAVTRRAPGAAGPVPGGAAGRPEPAA